MLLTTNCMLCFPQDADNEYWLMVDLKHSYEHKLSIKVVNNHVRWIVQFIILGFILLLVGMLLSHVGKFHH
jgi:hypothetical protein